ncbi:zinc-binding alcohol dehydrogenase family protein [Cyclobacterium plantarum]|uniref:zinc-binding alcohol dehydrogenase family protein n=1 Tax=Cyclobacterium plantarum TaxID=2716263 RepID=UPI003F708A24
MKAIRCEQPGSLKQQHIEVPAPAQHEVQVKIKKIGVCGTDLHAFAGNQAFFSYPRILGHEIAATISQSNGSRFQSGDPVVVIPYIHCGVCNACLSGKTNCCTTLKVLGVHIDGAMQEYMSLPPHLLLPSPELSWTEMAMVEPLSVAAHAVRRAGVQAGEEILVMGCGPIGLAIMVFAHHAAAKVTALDTNPERLKLAKDHFHAENTIDAAQLVSDPGYKTKFGAGFNTVFDATGNKQAMESGPFFAAHGGKYILVGLYKDQLCFHHPSIHAKELSLLCSRNATKADFLEVMKILALKKFPTENYHTHDLGFDEVPEKFTHLTLPSNQVIKAMISI